MEGVKINKIYRCGHIFHPDCLREWLEKKRKDPKCPLCNVNVKSAVDEQRVVKD